MDEPMFSIVIPIYNVEKYLKACLRSVVNQTYKNFEIILVDDGSPDDCPEICDLFKETEPRCIVVHQLNKGLSGARNVGLKLARGKYVYFLDSDDIISDSLLERLYETFMNNNADVIGFDAVVIEGKNSYSLSTGSHTGKIVKGIEVAKKRVPLSTVPLYCYRRSFLLDHRLCFKEKIYYEDVLFTAQVFLENPNVYYLNEQHYYYHKREESITTSHVTNKNYMDMVDICETLINDDSRYDKNKRSTYKNILRSYILLSEEVYRMMSVDNQHIEHSRRNELITLVRNKKSTLGMINYIIATHLNMVYLVREIRRQVNGINKNKNKN